MDVVAVVGLGYVGLPLAVAFGKIMPTIGYDLSLPKLGSFRQCVGPSGTASGAAVLCGANVAAPAAAGSNVWWL